MVVLLFHRSIFFIVLKDVQSSWLFLFSYMSVCFQKPFPENVFLFFYLVSERATLRSVQLRFTKYVCYSHLCHFCQFDL